MLVLTRKFGHDIPAERLADRDVLAREDAKNPVDGERGILREVLTPGSYRINPYAYSYETVPAIEIRVDQVGVRSLMVGKDPAGLPADADRGSLCRARRVSWHPAIDSSAGHVLSQSACGNDRAGRGAQS